ncbi:DUF2155 domain-containing protein [Meridianimarinicoccus sp. RP-17]|uniref:DUF2155 domain-containing protein n=1 Tax=Meridianimarinicoccus zhengii TaxID=2056810 RepID=UPI000DAF1937|nr:DUF2155 domain-containing protein [Phycocomes zhengii]
MRRVCAWLAAACLGGAALPAAGQEVAAGDGALLRGLDRLSGSTTDIPVPAGAAVIFAGRLSIELRECRYPVANPTGDAYAFLSIRDTASGQALFDGWMIASAPALNALDHMRYDIWVLRCTSD